jgi:hypothetical protein
VIAAPERDVKCARDDAIGRERSLAGQQPRILDALDARTDVLGPQPRPTSAPSTPNARWRPSVIEVGPFRRGAPLRIVVTADHGGAARLDPSGLRRRFHRLADMSGVVRDDLRSSVTACILIFPRLTFGHHHPNGSDTMLLVAHAAAVIAQTRADSQSRRRARHPLFRVIFHQTKTTAPAAAPSLLTLYAKERVKWLIIL